MPPAGCAGGGTPHGAGSLGERPEQRRPGLVGGAGEDPFLLAESVAPKSWSAAADFVS